MSGNAHGHLFRDVRQRDVRRWRGAGGGGGGGGGGQIPGSGGALIAVGNEQKKKRLQVDTETR
jgi:hypothetical protein